MDQPEKTNKINSFKIQKIPFNGKALNLIDKFLVIGYDQFFFERDFPKLIEGIKEKQKKYSNQFEYSIKDRPSILNEIVFDYEKQLINNEMILQLLFPSNVKFFYFPSSKQFEPFYIIFSINPQDNDGSKKSSNGFGYIFYRNQKINNNLYVFIPKVFFILSEYPYYTSFLELCKLILTMISTKDSTIPIETFIYNFIKFIPAPIETAINISITNRKHLRENEKRTKRKENRRADTMKRLSLKGLEFINDISLEEISPYEKYYPKIEETDIFFKQLSGYPIAQINLTIFFSLLPFELIIEIFLFTFLEHDIMFFSENLELINIVMYCFYLFNFPCNDSIYFWHILSVSIDDLIEGNSNFVGKTCSTMLGINASYSSSYKTTQIIKEHFIVDLDEKKFFLLARDKNSDTAKKTQKLSNWFKTIIAKNKLTDNSGLEGIISQLIYELKGHSEQAELVTHNVEKINIHELYKDSKAIQMQNTIIQESFYQFFFGILQLSNSFEIADNIKSKESENMQVKRNSVTSSLYQDGNFIVRYQEKDDSQSDYEKIFNKKFKECSKYNTFMINFMLYYEALDVYKIPLLLSEEIISRKQKMDSFEQKNVDMKNLYDLLNNFYKIKKQENILDLSKKYFRNHKKEIITDINIKELFIPDDTENILKEICSREQSDDPQIFGKIKKRYSFNYPKCEFSMKLLMRYIYELEQMTESELKGNFPILETKALQVSDFKEIKVSAISDLVEEFFILKQIFTYKELINLSIFMLITITTELTLNVRNESEAAFALRILTKKRRINIKSFEELKVFHINVQYFRQYVTQLLTLYIKLIDKFDKDKDLKKKLKYEDFLMKCFKELIQEKTVLEIIPNHEFMECINWYKNNKEDKEDIFNRRKTFDLKLKKKLEEANKRNFEPFDINWDTTHINNFSPKDEPKILMHLAVCLGKFAYDNYIPKYGESTEEDDDMEDEKPKEINPQFIFCSFEKNSQIKPAINLFNPRKLFNESKKLFLKFFEHFTIVELDKNMIKTILWNQIFYVSKAKCIVEHKKETESKEERESIRKKKGDGDKDEKNNQKKKMIEIEKELQDIYEKDEREILLPILVSTLKSIQNLNSNINNY